MNIALSVLYIHPSLIPEKDFTVTDNWSWPELTWYNKTIPQPTQADLESAWLEVVKLQDIETHKQEQAESIAKIATLTDQLNQLALIMEEMVLERETITPTMQKGLDMTNGIKNILNK